MTSHLCDARIEIFPPYVIVAKLGQFFTPRGFEEQAGNGIYFRGIGEQVPNFEGNIGTKTILGNREHKKTNFRFLGNRGTSQFISGEQGNMNPHPLGGPL